jgi:hypothetical protein
VMPFHNDDGGVDVPNLYLLCLPRGKVVGDQM